MQDFEKKIRSVIKDYWDYFADKRILLRRIIEYAIKADVRYEPRNIHEFVVYHRIRRLSNQFFGTQIDEKSITTINIEKGYVIRDLSKYIGVGIQFGYDK